MQPTTTNLQKSVLRLSLWSLALVELLRIVGKGEGADEESLADTTDLAAGIKHVHRVRLFYVGDLDRVANAPPRQNFSKVSGELKVLYECAPGQASSRRQGIIFILSSGYHF